MKKLLILLLLPFSSFAQEVTPKPVYTTPETPYYYLRGGTSVGNLGEKQSSFVLGALGTRRYADEFFYGTEFSTHYGAEEYQTTLININMGYHFLVWKHRIKPYVAVNFGYGFIKDTTELSRPEGSGVNMGLDFGFDLFSLGLVKTFTGIKYDHLITNRQELKSSSFLDLYFGIGIRF